MKKILYQIATVLQILLIITAYLIQTLSMKKMGVMRFIVYMNHTWNNLYPIDKFQHITITILAILTVIILIIFFKINKNGTVLDKVALRMVVLLTIITMVSVIFTLGFSTADYRSYYFISFILAMVTLIQDIKISVYLRKLAH
ncbi:hypothetical protein [Desulfosporosinus nitroreducens]|uniref:hypothetical protein n=1 Tax=Desulfosporosinus nitroreducens TaxID=2018668 RepID=UPI00207C6273|nr:hypothetical protein [Desulfosporosinus nitroreducens]MCO1601953.1 hypothetical protein [Desulfosporosinus nitroreducens]